MSDVSEFEEKLISLGHDPDRTHFNQSICKNCGYTFYELYRGNIAYWHKGSLLPLKSCSRELIIEDVVK